MCTTDSLVVCFQCFPSIEQIIRSWHFIQTLCEPQRLELPESTITEGESESSALCLHAQELRNRGSASTHIGTFVCFLFSVQHDKTITWVKKEAAHGLSMSQTPTSPKASNEPGVLTGLLRSGEAQTRHCGGNTDMGACLVSPSTHGVYRKKRWKGLWTLFSL